MIKVRITAPDQEDIRAIIASLSRSYPILSEKIRERPERQRFIAYLELEDFTEK